jgi:hypothetical protein
MRPIEITLDYDGATDTDWWPLDIYNPNQVTTISVNLLSGSILYDVEYTNEDVFDLAIDPADLLPQIHPVAAFDNATGSVTASTTTLMRSVRVKIASGTGSIRVTVVQQSTV